MSGAAEDHRCRPVGGAGPGRRQNRADLLRQHGAASRSAARTMRELFFGAYAQFAALCREVDEPGLAMLAVDEPTGRPAGLVRLRARVGRHVAAIVGRHDQCDLFLDHHSSLALRHLAIVLDPVQSWTRGRRSVALPRARPAHRARLQRRERPVAARPSRPKARRSCAAPVTRCSCCRSAIRRDWPEAPGDAWAMLPERVYFDELRGDASTARSTNMPSAPAVRRQAQEHDLPHARSARHGHGPRRARRRRRARSTSSVRTCAASSRSATTRSATASCSAATRAATAPRSSTIRRCRACTCCCSTSMTRCS